MGLYPNNVPLVSIKSTLQNGHRGTLGMFVGIGVCLCPLQNVNIHFCYLVQIHTVMGKHDFNTLTTLVEMRIVFIETNFWKIMKET